MSLMTLILLFLVINPLTALLIPVLFRLSVKSEKYMDYYTYGKYALLYFALVATVSFASVHLENQSSEPQLFH